MNLNSLNVPIIVYWDITPMEDMSPHIIHTLSDDFVKNRIFVLHLWDASPTLSTTSATVLEKLKNEHMNVSLTVPVSALDGFDMKEFMPALSKIIIHNESLAQLSSGLEKIKSCQTEAIPIGVSIFVHETTYRSIPDVLKKCLQAGIKDIHFPIQRPKSGQTIFSPDEEVIRWLSDKIRSIETSNLNINIHDPFLWALFNEGMNENTKGCQAANSMVYITGDLTLTPCPLIPIALGDLKHSTLTEVFLSDKRQEVRKRLSTSPHECVGCEKLNSCAGGCRGRAYMYFQTFDKRDPACHYVVSI
jgi:GeoRSP system SPASM domain protein